MTNGLTLCAAAWLLLAQSHGAHAQQGEKLDVVSVSNGRTARISADLMMPRGATGKTPALIILHGASGVSDKREYAYAREFQALGVAAAVVDSFAAREVTSTIEDQSLVGSQDMLADAVHVFRMLARDPRIDSKRIGLIGFSKGGTAAIKAALRRYMRPLGQNDAFALLIAVYPWCGDFPRDMRSAGTTLHVQLGGDDTYSGVAVCQEIVNEVRRSGGAVEVKVYAGAQHGWDVPGPRRWILPRGQNLSRCAFDEIERGVWVERSSGLKIAEERTGVAANDPALLQCMTRGVSGGYSRRVHEQSLADLRAIIRAAFGLP